MRKQAQERIDALHSEIARIVAEEKAHHDAMNPCEYHILRQIAHTRIDHAALSASMRESFVWATASLPTPPTTRDDWRHNEQGEAK